MVCTLTARHRGAAGVTGGALLSGATPEISPTLHTTKNASWMELSLKVSLTRLRPG